MPASTTDCKTSIRAAGVLLLCVIAAANVRAYDADTHYWLTYYLARKAGYTPAQAEQAASANISVDIDADVSPVNFLNFHPQDQRSWFHALPPTKDIFASCGTTDGGKLKGSRCLIVGDKLLSCVAAYVNSEERRRRVDAIDSGNPGIFLHFFQDKFAHRGFTGRFGHGFYGHIPDYLDSDPDKARQMVIATIRVLRRFMQEYRPDKVLPPEPDMVEVMRVVDSIIAANRSQNKMGDFVKKDADAMSKAECPGLLVLVGALKKSPNPVVVSELVKRELPGESPLIHLYGIDKNGRPEGFPNPKKSTRQLSYERKSNGDIKRDIKKVSDDKGIPWKLS